MALLITLLVSACDLWPRELKPLAKSIASQAEGEATAWLLGGDMVAIDVANSPGYRMSRTELEALAAGIAEQAIAYSDAPLESILVTFHEGAASGDPEKSREFVFLVTENRPVLQPTFDFDASGPLTADEIQAAIDRIEESYEDLGKPLAPEHRECLVAEMEQRARHAGDPETLDPADVEFLGEKSWHGLDAFGKRLFLAQAITSKALFVCAAR